MEPPLFPFKGFPTFPTLPGQKTLNQLFPGNMGRLQFVRVMLRLFHPGLDEWPWDKPLEPELLAKIEWAIIEDRKG